MEKENQKPLTLNDLTDYTQKVLLPAFDKRLDKLESEVTGLRSEFSEFRNETLSNFDNLFKKIDIILESEEIRKYQKEKEKKFFAILIKSLKKHNILSTEELTEIAKLEIL